MAKKVKAKKAQAKKPIAKKSTAKSTKKVAKKKATPKTAKKLAKLARTKKVVKQPATKNTVKSVVKVVTDWQAYLAPLYDRVLLQKEKQEIISKAGLYLGEAENSATYAKAKVLAVGKGLLSKKGQVRPLDVSEGDTVMYKAYAGNVIKVEGQELVIVKEEEILGIMEN